MFKANSLSWRFSSNCASLADSIVTDDHSRKRLLKEIDNAMRQAAEQQQKRANGDYSPDPKADRFSPLRLGTDTAPANASTGPSITALFKLWERDHLAEGRSSRTVGDFRQKINSLTDWLGHDEALKVTPEAIADWCEHLRHEKKLQARTVSQKYLAVVKLIFKLAVEKRKLKTNPADGNKVRYSKPQRTRSAGYTDAEARVLLRAALLSDESLSRWSDENRRAVRWGPWIFAFSRNEPPGVVDDTRQPSLQPSADRSSTVAICPPPDAARPRSGLR